MIAPSGDIVAAKGTITGGYIDLNKRRSRLELQAHVDAQLEAIAGIEREQAELRRQLETVDSDIRRAEQRLANLEAETRQAKCVALLLIKSLKCE